MSTSTLQHFTFGTQNVRTVIEDGQIKFVACDVCNALGLPNPSKATTNLDDDEKGITITDTPGGRQPMITVTESGLWHLVLCSRRPEAKTFKKWVTNEVLPALRRTGTYSTPQVVPQFDLPKNYLEALKALVTSTEETMALKLTVAAQQPAVEFVDRYVHAEGLFGIRETAKLLGISQHEFTSLCQRHRILFREGGTLQPYAEHLKAGYFQVKAGEANDHAYAQTRFTAKGIEWVRRKLPLQQAATLQLTA
jgi:prophage antirepressor-like protein